MKKKFLLLAGLIGLFAGSSLIGCSSSTKTITDLVNNTGTTMGLQAVTGMKLLNEAETTVPLLKGLNRSVTDEEISTIQEILPQLDVLLENDGLFASNIETGSFEIESTIYENKETLSFVDSNLQNQTYVLYYNIIDSYSREERDGWEVETKTYTRIEGLATFDNIEFFSFISIAESEVEGNETEFEQSFKVNVSEDTYVFVELSNEQEWNESEIEFEYTLVQNNRKVLEYSIEIENEGFFNEIESEINNQKYKITKLENSNIYIVEIESNNKYENEIARFEKVIDELENVTFVALS